MRGQAVLFATGNDERVTPPGVFLPLQREFQFTLDAAATAANTRCARWLGPGSLLAADGLLHPWVGERVWCNPPYSRGLQRQFIRKAAGERMNGVLAVLLLPARTDTRAFHNYIWDGTTHRPQTGVEVRFLSGRIRFEGEESGAPFPSMVVVFRPREVR